MIDAPSVVVRESKTYDVKIGDTIWAQTAWLKVWNIRDNGYGDVSFHEASLGGLILALAAGAEVLIREDDWTLIPNNLREGASIVMVEE